MVEVAAIGEILIDLAETGVNTYGYPILSANPGGAPANFLASLNKFGIETAFIGKVGCDAFGDRLISTMKSLGVETKGIVRDPKVFTTLAFVTIDEDGDRTFSFARKPGADIMLAEDEVDFEIIKEASVLHFGTLSLTDEPSKSATCSAIAFAKEHGKLITFDPNWREPLWESACDAKEQILWGITQADAVKMSDEEVAFLWGCSADEAMDKLLDEYGVRICWITLGAAGCLFGNKNCRGRARYMGDLSVKDTTGAGDIFGGSAVSRMLKTGKSPEELNMEEMSQIAAFASAAASLSVQISGGISSVPEEAEVLAHLQYVKVTVSERGSKFR